MDIIHEETQYLDLIKRIMEHGATENGRNGKVKSIFGNMMRFDLKHGTLPILSTKQMAWKACFRELMWFIRGETDNRILKSQGVHIWDDNGTREFLDSRHLESYPEDILGPIYGWQWRRFNAPYIWEGKCDDNDKIYISEQTDYCNRVKIPNNEGIDQLKQIIDALKDPNQRSSRRLIMTAWNPCQLDLMALPPCHILCQFNVREGKYLSCALYQRSGDVGLGVPFNITSYSFLTHMIARHCDLEADEFVYFLGNAHIYEEHLEPLKKQLLRTPLNFPRIYLEKKEHIEDYTLDDIKWESSYVHHPSIKMKMVA
jgi:thymidylate synthase